MTLSRKMLEFQEWKRKEQNTNHLEQKQNAKKRTDENTKEENDGNAKEQNRTQIIQNMMEENGTIKNRTQKKRTEHKALKI